MTTSDNSPKPGLIIGDAIARMEPSPKARWSELIRDKYRDKCANCGSPAHTAVRMIVPLECGGTYSEGNGTLLCRACELVADSFVQEGQDNSRRLINLWLSQGCHEQLRGCLKAKNGFASMSGLVRYLMDRYVEDPSRYDDLNLYADDGIDVKINIWVDREVYAQFKPLVDGRGSTVTDTIKSLILLYAAETAQAGANK